MIYLFTLDSHDWYGPFTTEGYAHEFAYSRFLSSYTLTPKPPVYAHMLPVTCAWPRWER